MTQMAYSLASRLDKIAESATIKMSQMARDLKSKGHDVISLSLGEPDFDTPDHIKQAAKDALDKGYTKYTPVPGLVEYRNAIIEKLKRDNGLDYSINEIMVSNGAKQSIANLCLALLNDGDEVIIFTPYWVSYFEIVKFADGIPVPLSAGIEEDFKVSAEQLRSAITDKTKMILFSSPCNPTGSVYTKEELTAIAEVLADHPNIVAVSDEIYEYINFTEAHASIAQLPGMKERTVTINGMSKGFAMTGWRLGYMAGPADIMKACAKIQGQFTSGATAFGQMAAAHALTSDLSPTNEMKKAFLKRKQLVIDGLNDIPGMQTNDPQGAFYIFPNISQFFGKSNGSKTIRNANDMTEFLLADAFVALVSGSAFGNDDCLRISYAASEETLIEAVRRIKTYLADFK